MTNNQKELAERLAREVVKHASEDEYRPWRVWEEMHPIERHQFVELVLAGLSHRDPVADRAAAWEASGAEYDRSIHHNGDAREWARFFLRTFPNCGADEATMHGWFANAMMAMHDGPCAKKQKDAEREAARQAWDAGVNYTLVRETTLLGDALNNATYRADGARERYLARAYPEPHVSEPEPPTPVLTWHDDGYRKQALADETGLIVGFVHDSTAYLVPAKLIGRYITQQQARDAVLRAALAEQRTMERAK